MENLRPYQEESRAAVFEFLRTQSGNPLAIIPAGGGSTQIIAAICNDAVAGPGGRVMILAPSGETSTEIIDKLSKLCPGIHIGVYISDLKCRDRIENVIVASFESVSGRARELGAFDVVVLAKSHLIPSSYDCAIEHFLGDLRRANSDTKIIGFSAQPYRIKSGPVVTAEPICSANGFVNTVCFSAGAAELIRDGYLCPLVTMGAMNKVDTEMLPLLGGDFDGCAAGELIDGTEFVEAACAEIVASTHDRRSVLIFSAAGDVPGLRMVYCLHKNHEIQAGYVDHVTEADERSDLVSRFRSGKLKYLIVDDLRTGGFDAPNVDCVVMLRPTLSKELYAYMVGQGLRVHPEKKDCLVLDFVGNALRHGPLDQTSPRMSDGNSTAPLAIHECANCRRVVDGAYPCCPGCGGKLQPPKYRRMVVLSSDSSSGSAAGTTTEHVVLDTQFYLHTKRNASAGTPKSMRVDYRISTGRRQSEFVCFEHIGYPGQKAVEWWQQRSPEPVPSTAEGAVAIAKGGGIAHTARITVRHASGEKYGRIIAYELVVSRTPTPATPTRAEKEISSDASQST